MSRRDLKSHWAQFLAIIGIGGVAVTLFVGLLANAESVENRVNQAYDEGNMADLWVTTSFYDATDREALLSLSGEAGGAEGRFLMAGRIGNSTVTSVVTPSLPSISKPYAFEKKRPRATITSWSIPPSLTTAMPRGRSVSKSGRLSRSLMTSPRISTANPPPF